MGLRDNSRIVLLLQIRYLLSSGGGLYWTLFDLVHMEDELAAIFGRKVDLVERAGVEASENYIRRRSILKSAQTIYATG